MSDALLDDQDLIKTVLRLKDFRPAKGTVGRITIEGQPGGSIVRYALRASRGAACWVLITVPPTDEVLSHIYRESEKLAREARNSVAHKTGVDIGGIILDAPGIGFDQ